jgi:hypothetical protein
MLLLIFVTMQELSRVIGKDQMEYIFLGDRKGELPRSEAFVERHRTWTYYVVSFISARQETARTEEGDTVYGKRRNRVSVEATPRQR